MVGASLRLARIWGLRVPFPLVERLISWVRRVRFVRLGRRRDLVILSRLCCHSRLGYILVFVIVRQLAHLIFLEGDVSRSRTLTALALLLRPFVISFAVVLRPSRDVT